MKNLRLIFNVLMLLPWLTEASGQELPRRGKIIYELQVNKFAFAEKEVQRFNKVNWAVSAFDAMKDNQKQFLVFNAALQFDNQQSLYTPLPDLNLSQENYWNGRKLYDQINTVYTDLSNKKTTYQKSLWNDQFLVKDDVRAITWKITDQTREIAGYVCRRANGLILDSIYVVAFYTAEIPVSAGPETFQGLPGMIMGVALPHLNLSWFAKEVDLNYVPQMQAPSTGKAHSFASLYELLKSYHTNRKVAEHVLFRDYF